MPIAKTLAVLSTSIVTLICHAKELPMNETKTYCIGRFLVDLPADAQINGQDYRYMFGRVESEPTELDTKSFDEMVARRANELRETDEDKGRTLKGSVSAAPTARALVTSENIFGSKNYGFEAYWLGDGTLFSLKTMDMDEDVFQGRVLPKLQDQLLPNLHARHSDDTPSQPGFCLKDGFISNDGATRQFEDAAITFKFARWPGVWVSVETTTVTKLGEPSLLQRIDGSRVWEAYKDVVSQVRTLRRGQRTINGRAGEEFLVTIPTDGGYRLHQFHWEAQGAEVGNGLQPTLTVELESGMTRENGVPVRPRLTDEQAVALFDAVTNSVRLRPVTGATVSDVQTPPKAPLGTLAQTGTPCPQTGWWTCPEAVTNEIEGGRRQRFEAGTPMPVVKVLPKRSFIDRLSGRQPKHDVTTVWKLIEYDAGADRT
jgi:hypothetical protein